MSETSPNPRRSTRSLEADKTTTILTVPLRTFRPRLLAIAVGVTGVLLVDAMVGPVAAQQLTLRASAKEQVQALLEEKAARTPAQRKISSRLLYEMKRRQGDPLMQAAPMLRSSVRVEPDGTTLVDIKANVTEALLRLIEALDGTVVSSFPQYQSIRAHVPTGQLEAVAQSPGVVSIRPADRAITNKVNTSQGDVAHRADLARADFGIDGGGTKICALSDGVDALASVQASGDLPAVSVLAGQAGSGSEGTAMLEIIFDLAPGAHLGFATAFGGQAGFAQNILDLSNAGGCDVIVDDVFYFAEPVFQDGIIAQAVDQVVASGAVYFSSAGNGGNLNDGTSGVWEGDYLDSGVDITVTNPSGTTITAGSLHEFGGGNFSNQLTRNAPFAVTLHWSDPVGGSVNDYDLCVLDSTLSTVFECSTDTQSGFGSNPFEIIGPSLAGERLVIINFADAAAPRYFHLNTIRGRLATATDGQTAGHSAAEGAFGVAAVNVATAGGGAFTGGPANPVEFFSSDGPRRVFFNADGTPITPGDFSATGGALRQKPDVAAADGVATATPGFNPFFGTSAAAPHAAAIAGLMRSFDPTLTAADIRDVFKITALDIEAPGRDRDSGVGIVDALGAVAALIGIVVDETTIDDTWQTVSLPLAFQNPVVIAGPPTVHEPDPGVVRLRKVGTNSFQARFQEWAYLGGLHASEALPYLVIEAGRADLPDGSILETGIFPLGDTGSWQVELFDQPFPAPPALFLTVQTNRGGQPVAARARKVTASGFEAALFEEQALMDGHAIEDVGYLAVYSPAGSGSVPIAGGEAPFLIQSPLVNHRFTPVLSSALMLQEEQSQDAEVNHVKETLSVLALGNQLFAQDVSSKGRDTIALRRVAPEFAAPMEWGTVDGVTHAWTSVPLSRQYTNPVVVARPVSARGAAPGVIRLRNIAGSSFELRYQEWDYLDGAHRTEQMFYLVAEAGELDLAGLTVEAGTLDTNRVLADGFEAVSFAAPVLDRPAVFTSVQTVNGADPVTTRLSDVTSLGFSVTMQEEEASLGGHATETLGWIAVERGSATTSDGRAVSVFDSAASHVSTVIPFGQTFDRLFPLLVADVVTTDSQDPVFLRYRKLTRSSVELFLQEEQSFDTEVSHLLESVSIFVAE